MIFPSYIFLFVFLPLVLLFWYSRINLDFKYVLLTIASWVFYGWWDYRFVSLLIISTCVDYYCGKNVYKNKDDAKISKWYLMISIFSNLSILFYFKYFDFFIVSFKQGMNLLGLEFHPNLIEVILPVGISFYTFQSLSYTIDIYRDKIEPAQSFSRFCAYVAFFPQLVAGPIVRYNKISEQFKDSEIDKFDLLKFNFGLWLFVLGLSKKILLADPLSPFVSSVFDTQDVIYTIQSWFASLAYTLQLYFDFSGYSDMAIGIGAMMGFRFPINFNSPYKASNISIFWKRWHMTFSELIRDYLYIPLGGNRLTTFKTLRNLVVTMFLAGLWHGAAYVFIIWGFFHGILLLIFHTIHERFNLKCPKVIAIFITFFVVNIGWVIFRSPNIDRMFEIFNAMIGANGFSPGWSSWYNSSIGKLPYFFAEMGGINVFIYMIIGTFVIFMLPNSQEVNKKQTVFTGLMIGLVLCAVILNLGKETPFLYFQF